MPTYGAECTDTSECLNPPRFDADVALYNEAAAAVVNGTVDSVLDLYALVVGACGGPGYASCDGVQLPSNVHFTDAGYEMIANATADAVRALLAR